MIRNEIIYTTIGLDGTRHENKAILDRPYSITHRGAEIILHRSHPTAHVTSVSNMTYSA